MKNILIAPDSFKGSLTAIEAAQAMARGARQALGIEAQLTMMPLADGGEGTTEALVEGAGGELISATVTGPQGESVNAVWGKLRGGEAIVEMAQASGLTITPPGLRNALTATSFGTGQLIRAARDAGCRKLLIGIGGSATTDGGTGALQALGVRFLDEDGNELPPGGAALSQLHTIDFSDLDIRLGDCEITVLCDVNNPLHGPQGAAHIFARQKGASPGEVELLDAGLRKLADVAARTLDRDYRELPGAGAAGGMGFGLMAFLGAQPRPGIEVVMEKVRFAEKLESADLILTGEGCLDRQTLSGKTIAGVARAAQQAKGGAGVPVIAFAGAVKLAAAQIEQLGLQAAHALADGTVSSEESIANAAALLEHAVEQALRL